LRTAAIGANRTKLGMNLSAKGVVTLHGAIASLDDLARNEDVVGIGFLVPAYYYPEKS
jgi:hypothetical protein